MTTVAFLKFGKEEHIQALREKGNIHMNFNSSFRREDSNKERFDKLEGAISNYYTHEGTLQIKAPNWDEWKNLKIFNTNLNEFADTSDIYTYSLYALTLEDLRSYFVHQIDVRMKEFGTHFLLISHPEEFLNRIKSYLDVNTFKYCGEMVQYYDLKEAQANLTLFNKPHTLKHQKEYRIVVKAKEDQPLSFNIGSISGFSEVFETKDLESFQIRLQQ